MAKPNRKTREELLLTETPCKPIDIVQIDTVGPLPKSHNGNQYAITLIDEMSKWLVIIPSPGKSAREIAYAIFHHFILIYGPMKTLKSDRGTEFVNEVNQELCKLLKIKHNISTSYHHETVGAIERSHRTLNEYLRKYLNGKMSDWDTFSFYFQFVYNTTKHDGLLNKYSPFEILFLRKNTMPKEILQGKVDPQYNVDDYVKETLNRLKIVYKETEEIINKVKLANKNTYDRKINPIKLKLGDMVKIVKQPYEKFKYIYEGPYIVKNLKDKNVIIELENGKLYELHKNRVIKY